MPELMRAVVVVPTYNERESLPLFAGEAAPGGPRR